MIGINRPEKRNAFDLESLDALAAAYEQLGTDGELRVGVLFAHGDHFSSGLHLAGGRPCRRTEGSDGDRRRRFDPWGIWGEPVPKPVVMAVQGIAYTLSIELALALATKPRKTPDSSNGKPPSWDFRLLRLQPKNAPLRSGVSGETYGY